MPESSSYIFYKTFWEKFSSQQFQSYSRFQNLAKNEDQGEKWTEEMDELEVS